MDFLTIRQTASRGLLPEHRLRALVKQGQVPGIRSGNRFLVNVEELERQLRAESLSAVQGERHS